MFTELKKKMIITENWQIIHKHTKYNWTIYNWKY